ncbi:single-stranded DNA-binding protein [Marinobacter sp. P4B1]|uniref:single-stranded DNA-binding protein n=1 Tax=Marinobacter sp. P4B1 TaxID=1119533 RepID=UPI00071DF7A0|nr:single-stranded DNA-binding protein [Marinobacter sp. P4B1]KRW83748.1 hypothetical protein AQ621_17005 [Marinobacter sp. P4B1]
MRGINKVTILGRIGQDPEVRYTQGGDPVVTLSVATNDSYTKNGQKVEQTDWHRVVVFGRMAEVAANYAKKGDPIYVEGKQKTRKWQNKDGQDVYTTEIQVTPRGELQLLGSRSSNGAGQQQQQSQPAQGAQPAPRQQAAANAPAPGGYTNYDESWDDDDIPF